MSEKLLTCCHDTGPFFAHIQNGRWVKSTPITPNLPVGHNAYAVQNRLYSPDRLKWPMKRIDFDPTKDRNPQNRGRSHFIEITWDEALDLVANEISRVKTHYGASAILHSPISHQWLSGLHNAQLWSERFFALLGGCSRMVGGTSFTGWTPGGALVWGPGLVATNNAADILENSRLIIHWASDVAVKRYRGYRQNYWLQKFKETEIKQIVIDPYFNDTAAIYGDEWVPILPETDEALMAAIAYIWITKGLVNHTFIQRYTVGFDAFKDYILGQEDQKPKTPKWASRICGLPEATIHNLAHDWATYPTYILCDYGGANRRHGAAEWSRMLITLQALQGNIGRPGRGLGTLSYTTRGINQKGIKFPLPPLPVNYRQTLRHAHFAAAIRTPPVTWTTIEIPPGVPATRTYPMPTCSPIKLIAFISGSGWFLNQIPGTTRHIKALQDPAIEFVYSHAAWWHTAPKFSDVIFPIRHIGERDDIVSWENYIVYSHTLLHPPGTPKNDLDIFIELANRLEFGTALTENNTPEHLLHQIYQRLDIPLPYHEFKAKGYYHYPLAPDNPQIMKLFHDFITQPDQYPLPTPSGKLEIYSQRIADFFGDHHPSAPVIPQYIPSPETRNPSRLRDYPLILTTPHPKLGRHSQWQNLSWHHDDYQMRIQGQVPVLINPTDAQARSIETGDLVRVYNDRGTIICRAYVTPRIRPQVIRINEGGWYTPQQPGLATSPDIGGNPNILIAQHQPEALCDGMVNCALVEILKEIQ